MRLTKVHYTVLDAVYRQGRAILYRVLTKKTMGKSSREEQSVTGRNFYKLSLEINWDVVEKWIFESVLNNFFQNSRAEKHLSSWKNILEGVQDFEKEKKKGCQKINRHRNAPIFIAHTYEEVEGYY